MAVNTKKWRPCSTYCFTWDLRWGPLASLDFRYAFLPEYYSGLLAGIAACFIVGGGTLKHMLKDSDAGSSC